MKSDCVAGLRALQTDLKELRKIVRASGDRVTSVRVRKFAEEVATRWVEEHRSVLEHKFHLAKDVVEAVSDSMKRLHVLSRPNNRRSSYLKVLDSVLDGFEDRLVLPVQQHRAASSEAFSLEDVIPGLSDADESDYLREAVAAANAGFSRAAIVLGWCAAVDRMQKAVTRIGFTKFNAASTVIKNQQTGKFRRWNKEFNLTTLSELQTVFDNDLIVVLEGMEMLDGNQAERLEVCFTYRNHSAHPGLAPIGRLHVVAFFSDIGEIILLNPAFDP